MPFFINKSGAQVWINDKGQRHREDGPAIILPNGEKECWLNGQNYFAEKYYKALYEHK